VKTLLFPKEFIPELNTKNLGNSTSFLTITHMTLSAKQFRKYGSLMTDVAAVFCFWTEQQRNRYSIANLRLVDTLEVLNTIPEGNSLYFPMIH
jgi:hypothetical protein